MGRFSNSGVHLVESLSLIEDSQHPCDFLIVFSKVDLLEKSQREKVIRDVTSLLRLPYLTSWCRYTSIQTTEYSSETGEGFEVILDWLRRLR